LGTAHLLEQSSDNLYLSELISFLLFGVKTFCCVIPIDISEYRLLKGTLFASLVLSMAAATKKEKKRRSLPLEGWR